ncbi:MAG: DUF4402 domain-containing protein [Bacteroidales bacterium]|nr:DUF4402 domain-containing protein [Bacteroidales bacterium]
MFIYIIRRYIQFPNRLPGICDRTYSRRGYSLIFCQRDRAVEFWQIFSGSQGGEIILSPESTVAVVGSVYKGSGAYNAASFYVSGDTDAAYTITLPSGAVILTHTISAKTMRVENWISLPAPGLGAGKLINGYQVVYVGATLKVGTVNDNPVGIYTGSYTITFDFN